MTLVPMANVNNPAGSDSSTSGVRRIISGTTVNGASARLVDPSAGVRVRIRLKSDSDFIANYDLVQVCAVDAGESALDWDHNHLLNVNDLIAFTEDLHHLWVTSQHPAAGISSGLGRSAYDWNKDGLINSDDACAYEEALVSAGAISAANVGPWWTLMNQYGWGCP